MNIQEWFTRVDLLLYIPYNDEKITLQSMSRRRNRFRELTQDLDGIPLFKNRKSLGALWKSYSQKLIDIITRNSQKNRFFISGLKAMRKLTISVYHAIQSRNTFFRYLAPVIFLIPTLVICLQLTHSVSEESPFLLFFATVTLSAWYGGLGSGVTATLLSALAINYYFLPPRFSFIIGSPQNRILLVIFLLEGLLISILSAALNTARKRSQENELALREHQDTLYESEERYRLLVSDIKDYAIYMLDTEGRVASWNEGARRILGYEEQEIVGKHFSIFFNPQEIKEGKPEEELRTAVIDGRLENERLYIRKDGSAFWASAVATAIQDETRQLRGFAKVVRDITERRQAEQERAQLLSLEQAAREEAQEAVKARDEFLSIASHELKTPLTSMLLQLQNGMRVIGSESLEKIPHDRLMSILKTSEQQSKRLASLINTLLDVSRITAGRLSLDIQKVNLSSLVQDIGKRFAEELKRSKSTLTIHAEKSIIGECDKLRIDQVVTNLLSNAIKYGGGKPIEVLVEREGSVAKIVVKDKGIGIAGKDARRIFDRFERTVVEKEYKGMGVGLFIVKKIVEAHGGEITVKSKLKQGSTFIVKLPISSKRY